MNTPSHSCPVAYHEGHVLLCFMSGKPCIYMDDRSCEKSREYHIREMTLRKELNTEQLELRVQEQR